MYTYAYIVAVACQSRSTTKIVYGDRNRGQTDGPIVRTNQTKTNAKTEGRRDRGVRGIWVSDVYVYVVRVGVGAGIVTKSKRLNGRVQYLHRSSYQTTS